MAVSKRTRLRPQTGNNSAPPDNCSRCLAPGVLVGTRSAPQLDRGAIYGDYDCPKCGSEWFTGWWADELA